MGSLPVDFDAVSNPTTSDKPPLPPSEVIPGYPVPTMHESRGLFNEVPLFGITSRISCGILAFNETVFCSVCVAA